MSGQRPSERPRKICAHCGLPFQWRRRWKDVWEEVRYCSARCRSQARLPAQRRNRLDPNQQGSRELPPDDAAKSEQKQGNGVAGGRRDGNRQLDKKGKRQQRR
jgi:hypothetical protein